MRDLQRRPFNGRGLCEVQVPELRRAYIPVRQVQEELQALEVQVWFCWSIEYTHIRML